MRSNRNKNIFKRGIPLGFSGNSNDIKQKKTFLISSLQI